MSSCVSTRDRAGRIGSCGRALMLWLALTGIVDIANAQLSTSDQACINAFSKGVRDVGKTQGKVVGHCLRTFASGALITSPEDCVLADPAGKVTRKSVTATGKTLSACPGSMPAFGVTSLDTAVPRAAVSEVDLVHATIGANLDTALVSDPDVADCQARVASALIKCHDARWRVFLKCQKSTLRSGLASNAASLTLACLSARDSDFTDADPSGRVAKMCAEKIGRAVSRQCEGIDLSEAFPAVQTSDAAAAVGRMVARSRCLMCQTANEVSGLSRDCDAFDDDDAANGTCGAECGDGVLQDAEGCDDGNSTDGDGCGSSCSGEAGWSCTGSPSECAPSCGNGQNDAGEGCDDGNASSGDGCSSTCQVERNFSCSGQPSVCAPNCGNGTLQSSEGEACDDGDRSGNDGCSATCQVEDGFVCSGTPSVCTFVCGNGTFQTGETCDDHNALSGDGCSSTCRIESGWLCSGQPSTCTPLCGDGLVRGGETCDDGRAMSGDGCSFSCQSEPGYTCSSSPSNCVPTCGDGFRRGAETCDDGDAFSGDGCSGSFCRQEPGYTCIGQPSVCLANCGDGNLDPIEDCDDGNVLPGDGCDPSCHGEPGYACGGQPSACAASCGNNVIQSGETCDDGNALSGDGCSASCRHEAGWVCNAPGQACAPFAVFIDSPTHGVFTTASSVVVSGHYTALPPGTAAVTVNGAAATVNGALRTFSYTLPLSSTPVFNPVKVTLTNTLNGDAVNDRIVVVAGPSVADGAFSPQSVALRMNDTGIDAIEPLMSDLAAGQFDLATLVPSGTVVLPWQCYFSFIWCWAGAEARIGSPAPSFGGIRVAADAKEDKVSADVMVDNLRIDIHIDGTGIVPDCGLRMTASQMKISADYALEPDSVDATHVDVSMIELKGVTFTNFQHSFIYGSCGLVSSRLGDVQQIASDAIAGFIDDPDGSGPEDSPIADAVEEALSGVSIAGAVGSGLGLSLDAPLFQVAEDDAGITLGAASRFTVSVGTGPGQCQPPPGAPDLTASYAPPETFPTFGALTPGSLPYGVSVAISTAGLNQLLRGQTECGLLRTSLTTIDLDGAGGVAPLPITAELLSLLAPEFSRLAPATALQIDVVPTMAPIVTGIGGPSGEITELKVAQVLINIVEPGQGTWLTASLDARLGMDLEFLPDGSGLGIVLSQPLPADTAVVVLDNPLGANATQLETLLPALIRPMIPELAGALAGFPLPEFFGLGLHSVEISRNGQFLSLFANLEPVP